MNIVDGAFALFRARGTTPTWPPTTISLALQGGGSFGAFTWGVLDRLLDEPGLAFDIVSGASAGAVNATVMTAGLIEGGPMEAKARLERFWKHVSDAAAGISLGILPGFSGMGLNLLSHALSSYPLNSSHPNSLREALKAEIDFSCFARPVPVRLMIAATRVSDGRLRIFRNAEMSLETVLASACLPLLQRAVEIDGEAYWDGGYAANPPLIPLVRETNARDILVVQIMPAKSLTTPVTSRAILKQLGRLTFNATLNAQVDALRLAAGLDETGRLADLRVTHLTTEDEIADLAQRSAYDLGWDFLLQLREGGRAAAQKWLAPGPPSSIPV